MLHFDTTRLPLIVIRDDGTEQYKGELESFLQAVDEVLLRWEPNPLVMLVDCRDALVPTKTQRQTVQRRLGGNTPAQRTLLGTAVVMRSDIFHYLVAAMLWGKDISYEVKEFGDINQAESWCCSLLGKHGYPADLAEWEQTRLQVVPEF